MEWTNPANRLYYPKSFQTNLCLLWRTSGSIRVLYSREEQRRGQAIMNKVMATIRKMHTEIQAMKAPKTAHRPTLLHKVKKSFRGLSKPLL